MDVSFCFFWNQCHWFGVISLVSWYQFSVFSLSFLGIREYAHYILVYIGTISCCQHFVLGAHVPVGTKSGDEDVHYWPTVKKLTTGGSQVKSGNRDMHGILSLKSIIINMVEIW